MRVPIISSSPRKVGNSAVLCGQFARGTATWLEAEKEAGPLSGVIYGTGTWDKGDICRHSACAQAYEIEKPL